MLQSDIFYVKLIIRKGGSTEMNSNELEICKRFKDIRTHLGMKQGDFASAIKTTQGHVSDIENGRKGVSDRVIEIICLKFNINENWFRTGNGNMYTQLNFDDRYASNVGKLQRTNDETIIHWVNAIAETSPEKLKDIEEFMKRILNIE